MIDKRTIKSLINDDIVVKLVVGEDKWGKVTYSEPLFVEAVHFDRSSIDKTQGTNIVRNNTGKIFIYPQITDIIVDDTWLQGIVNDMYREYKIIGYEVNYYQGKVFSYELEVI